MKITLLLLAFLTIASCGPIARKKTSSKISKGTDISGHNNPYSNRSTASETPTQTENPTSSQEDQNPSDNNNNNNEDFSNYQTYCGVLKKSGESLGLFTIKGEEKNHYFFAVSNRTEINNYLKNLTIPTETCFKGKIIKMIGDYNYFMAESIQKIVIEEENGQGGNQEEPLEDGLLYELCGTVSIQQDFSGAQYYQIMTDRSYILEDINRVLKAREDSGEGLEGCVQSSTQSYSDFGRTYKKIFDVEAFRPLD